MKSDPTDEQAEQFLEVMKLTGRSDLKFTPYLSVIYEKRLSEVTYLIVEAIPKKNTYYYDFYKVRYYKNRSEGCEMVKYCEKVLAGPFREIIESYFEVQKQ